MNQKVKEGSLILDLLVTTGVDQEKIYSDDGCIFLDSNTLYLVATKIKKCRGEAIDTDVIINSTKVGSTVFANDFILLGSPVLQTTYDLSDFIHFRTFMPNSNGEQVSKNSEAERLFLKADLTKYCQSLNYLDYIWLIKYLTVIQERAFYASLKQPPRHSNFEILANDDIHQAISLFLSRMVAIANNAFFWRNNDLHPFCREKDLSMQKILK